METELINEGGFNYIENGDGRPIIILHGLMGGLSNFKGVYDYFPSVEHKVIIPELPVDSTPILKTNVATFSKFVFEFIQYKNLKDVVKADFLMVNFSDKIKDSEKEIKFFLRSKMYNNENVLSKNNNGKIIIENLFKKISKNPKKFLSKDEFSKNKYRAISDFISGMTDRYAINLYNNIK